MKLNSDAPRMIVNPRVPSDEGPPSNTVKTHTLDIRNALPSP